jgi:hypothetical protein
MVAGWIRTGSELSENHDNHSSSQSLAADLKFHRAAPLASRSLLPVPGPSLRDAPTGPERIGDLAPQGTGPFRGIVTTSPRDFAERVCGTK